MPVDSLLTKRRRLAQNSGERLVLMAICDCMRDAMPSLRRDLSGGAHADPDVLLELEAEALAHEALAHGIQFALRYRSCVGTSTSAAAAACLGLGFKASRRPGPFEGITAQSAWRAVGASAADARSAELQLLQSPVDMDVVSTEALSP